jgi:hypothetical protein
MPPDRNNPDALGPVGERIWGRYGSSPGLIATGMSEPLLRRRSFPGRIPRLPLLTDLYQRWATGKASPSYSGPGASMVWLSAFPRAANEITDANPPFAGTRAPHLRNVSAESARAAVSANTGSGDAGRRFSSPVLRATQGRQPSHSLSGSTSSPRTHYISSLINTAPQATAPGPSIAANIARSAPIFRGFQPMSEARVNEGQEGRKGISGSGLLERHWWFPAVARTIKAF